MNINGEVTLTGSNVLDALTVRKQVTVHSRAIRNASANITNLIPPNGAKGFLWIIKVYAVTGTTPSLILNTYTGDGAGKCPFNASITAITSSQSNLGVLWYPGSNTVDVTKSNSLNKIVSLPIGTYVEFNASITGTFVAGEGFDMESEVIWLF